MRDRVELLELVPIYSVLETQNLLLLFRWDFVDLLLRVFRLPRGGFHRFLEGCFRRFGGFPDDRFKIQRVH